MCLADGRLRTATSYLIILQTMQPLAVGGKDTIRLLQKAMDEDDYELCKELVRFLSSIDSKWTRNIYVITVILISCFFFVRLRTNTPRGFKNDKIAHGK